MEARLRDILAERGLWFGRLGEPDRGYGGLPAFGFTRAQIAAWIEVEEVRQLYRLRQRAIALAVREQEPLGDSLERILGLLDAALETS